MNLGVTILIGVAAGFLDGVGIFFAPEEPYKVEILLAAILKGVLVSLLVAFSQKQKSTWWQGALRGMLYGFLFALVIFLAKGAFKSMDAPFVVPSGIVMGALTGILVNRYVFSK
jgi:hypothetical protein